MLSHTHPLTSTKKPPRVGSVLTKPTSLLLGQLRCVLPCVVYCLHPNLQYQGDSFTLLNSLRKGDARINVLGVVTFVNPERKTRTNGQPKTLSSCLTGPMYPFVELHRSFSIVDPSTVDSGLQSVTVNCFQKKYTEWLPQVQKGDVVILRKLKVSLHPLHTLQSLHHST